MHDSPSPSGEQLLRLPATEAKTGLKKSAIYAGMRADPPTFPLCIKLGPRTVAWPASAIDAWIVERIATAKRRA